MPEKQDHVLVDEVLPAKNRLDVFTQIEMPVVVAIGRKGRHIGSPKGGEIGVPVPTELLCHGCKCHESVAERDDVGFCHDILPPFCIRISYLRRGCVPILHERNEAALVSQPYGAAEERRREVIRRVRHTRAGTGRSGSGLCMGRVGTVDT